MGEIMAYAEDPSMEEIYKALALLGLPYTEEQARGILTEWGSQFSQFCLRQHGDRSGQIISIFIDQLNDEENSNN